MKNYFFYRSRIGKDSIELHSSYMKEMNRHDYPHHIKHNELVINRLNLLRIWIINHYECYLSQQFQWYYKSFHHNSVSTWATPIIFYSFVLYKTHKYMSPTIVALPFQHVTRISLVVLCLINLFSAPIAHQKKKKALEASMATLTITCSVCGACHSMPSTTMTNIKIVCQSNLPAWWANNTLFRLMNHDCNFELPT